MNSYQLKVRFQNWSVCPVYVLYDIKCRSSSNLVVEWAWVSQGMHPPAILVDLKRKATINVFQMYKTFEEMHELMTSSLSHSSVQPQHHFIVSFPGFRFWHLTKKFHPSSLVKGNYILQWWWNWIRNHESWSCSESVRFYFYILYYGSQWWIHNLQLFRVS